MGQPQQQQPQMGQPGQPNNLYNMVNIAAMQQQQPYTGPKRKFESNQSLYVGNLSPTTFDNDLFKHFSSRGYKLAQVRVMMDTKTSQSKCFAYLNFHTAEEAERCLNEL